ncbi:hypothetical protein G6F61_013162 [Rhizopus arrhizus]|nr:hypothetical protein G6F61_013162 [Rhizopus arrhizus]
MAVAEHAQRIIEIRDGRIVDDRPTAAATAAASSNPATLQVRSEGSGWQALRDRFGEAFRMALRAMNAHRMRTFLTMLGIIIGIASVVSVVALGNGSQQQILQNISALGTNTIDVYPGRGFGDMRAARVQTLKASDADALAKQSYVDSATPSVSTSVTARYRNQSSTAQRQLLRCRCGEGPGPGGGDRREHPDPVLPRCRPGGPGDPARQRAGARGGRGQAPELRFRWQHQAERVGAVHHGDVAHAGPEPRIEHHRACG